MLRSGTAESNSIQMFSFIDNCPAIFPKRQFQFTLLPEAQESPGCYPCLHLTWLYLSVLSTSQNIRWPELNFWSPPTTFMKVAPTTAFPIQSMRASSLQVLRPKWVISSYPVFIMSEKPLCSIYIKITTIFHHSLLLPWSKPPSELLQ